MATLQITREATGSRLLDRWTWGAVGLTIAPLILWGAASVLLLAIACGVPWYLAWIPSASTTGVMLVSSIFAMRETLSDHVRAYARRLAYSAISLDTVVSGLHLALPTDLQPGWGWLLLVGMLPPLMGGVTWHMVTTAIREHRATIRAHAEQVAATAQAAQDAETARRETIARREAAETAARKQAASAAVVNAALTGPTLVRTPAKPAVKRSAPTLRDKAIAELVRRHRAGTDIRGTVAAELDRAIGASKYCNKFLPDLITHVLTAEQGVA